MLGAISVFIVALASLWAPEPGPQEQGDQLPGFIRISGLDIETEPGAHVVLNDQYVLLQLRQVLALQSDRDAEVIRDIRSQYEIVSPPLLMEMGRRLYETDSEEAAYYWWLGLGRMRLAASTCRDSSAIQFVQIVGNEFLRVDSDVFRYFDESPFRDVAYRRLLEDEAMFDDRVSAWWVCSHGIQALTAVAAGDAVRLADWRVSSEDIESQRQAAHRSLMSWVEVGDDE